MGKEVAEKSENPKTGIPEMVENRLKTRNPESEFRKIPVFSGFSKEPHFAAKNAKGRKETAADRDCLHGAYYIMGFWKFRWGAVLNVTGEDTSGHEWTPEDIFS